MKYEIRTVVSVDPLSIRSNTLRALAKHRTSRAFFVRAKDVPEPFEVVCLVEDARIAVAHGALVVVKDAVPGERWENEARRVVDEALAWWRDE